jgi:hypothetical protein
MGEPETTGTPGATQEGANAGNPASGTPAASTDGGNATVISADERAELESLRSYKGQALAEKDTLERVKQENEWLRQQAEQGRAYPPPTGYDPAAQQAQRIALAYQNLSERDPEAAELISATARMTHEQLERQKDEQRFYRELGGVPQEYQAEVERISRTGNVWPSIALNQVKAQRYDKTRSDLAEQSRKIQEHEDKLKRGVVRTDASPAPPAAKSDEITDDEYNQLIASAEKGNRDARKKLDDVDYGRIRIRAG